MPQEISDILNTDDSFPARAGWHLQGVRTDASGNVLERGDVPLAELVKVVAIALGGTPGSLRTDGTEISATAYSDTEAHNQFSLYTGVTEKLFGAEVISKSKRLVTSGLGGGGQLAFLFPDVSNDRNWTQYTEGSGDITVSLAAMPVGWNRAIRFVGVHKNIGGANAKVFASTDGTTLLRNTIANPSVAEIPPGKFGFITIDFLPMSPTPVGIVTVLPIDLGTLRKTPRIGAFGSLPSAASAVTALTGVLSGRTVVLVTRRFNTTHNGPTSPTITWLAAAVVDSTASWNQSIRIGAFNAASNDPSVTNPGVATNTLWFELIDNEPFVTGTPANTFPVNGAVKVTADGNSDTVIPGPNPAHTEPLFWLSGYAAGGSVTWVLPPAGDVVIQSGGAGNSGMVAFKHPLGVDAPDLTMLTSPAHGLAFHLGIRGALYS